MNENTHSQYNNYASIFRIPLLLRPACRTVLLQSGVVLVKLIFFIFKVSNKERIYAYPLGYDGFSRYDKTSTKRRE